MKFQGPSKIDADVHPPESALTAGLPFKSTEPSSVIPDSVLSSFSIYKL